MSVSKSKAMTVLLVLLLSSQSVFGQKVVRSNPGDLDDLRGILANPSLTIFQDRHLIFAAELFHLGFVDDNQYAFKSGFYQFGRSVRIPDELSLKEKFGPFTIKSGKAKLKKDYYVYATVTELEIFEKIITRVFDEDITDQELDFLTAYDVGVLDSSRVSSPFSFVVKPITIPEHEVPIGDNYSVRYKASLQEIADQLKRKPSIETTIVISEKEERRAVEIQKSLARSANISPKRVQLVTPVFRTAIYSLEKTKSLKNKRIPLSESLTLLSEPHTIFRIIPINVEVLTTKWELTLSNDQGNVIKTFSGEGKTPKEILWDWTDNKGLIIPAGIYTYKFEWLDAGGKKRSSNQADIYVRKTKRHITVEVTKQMKYRGQDIEEVHLRLGKTEK